MIIKKNMMTVLLISMIWSYQTDKDYVLQSNNKKYDKCVIFYVPLGLILSKVESENLMMKLM